MFAVCLIALQFVFPDRIISIGFKILGFPIKHLLILWIFIIEPKEVRFGNWHFSSSKIKISCERKALSYIKNKYIPCKDEIQTNSKCSMLCYSRRQASDFLKNSKRVIVKTLNTQRKIAKHIIQGDDIKQLQFRLTKEENTRYILVICKILEVFSKYIRIKQTETGHCRNGRSAVSRLE